MPIYEYECFSCGTHFDRRQRFDEEPVGVCPNCQGKARRVIHCVPVIFKGSGFYVTDNPKRSYSESANKKSEERKSEGDKKSEDKPAENIKSEDKKPEAVSASGKKDSEN